MPSTTFPRTSAIEEGSSATYQTTLVDSTNTPINPVAVSAITVTLIDERTQTVINSRNAQNCLNANGGTLSAGAVFQFKLTSADTVTVVGDTARYQPRVLTFKVTFSTGALNHRVLFWVENLESVT
jgi:hypothetical protein